ncbi:MAG TPA: hypothetical protein VE287_12600, partial [Actinopolymorphaceae bacterium]|nr:hypothetical protein [Actinopolymorphaceae bacterium]
MTDLHGGPWHALPDIELRTPVLALATDPADASGDERGGRLWIGGVGGIAPLGSQAAPGEVSPDAGSQSVGLASVAAMCFVGGWLVAGGADGLVRYRGRDSGGDDEVVEVADVQGSGAPVAALLALPADNDSGDGVVLAATLGDGVLRSYDRGRTWTPTTFGLDDAEVSALCVLPGGGVLAGTASGIFAATPGIRAWRRSTGTDGVPIAALASVRVDVHDRVVAAGENGEILRSDDGAHTWAAAWTLAARPTAIVASDATLVVGTAGEGLWRSTDGGTTWARAADDGCAMSVYCLGRSDGHLYAGTPDGLARSSDDGVTWEQVAVPATHDLDRLLLLGSRPVVAGGRSGVVRLDREGSWSVLDGAPFPLTGVAVAAGIGPDGGERGDHSDDPGDGDSDEGHAHRRRLLASGPAGLSAHSGAAEASWSVVTPDEPGYVGAMSILPSGHGLAAPARHGDQLLRTTDGGMSFDAVPAPFGAFPLVALQVADGVVLAATSDPRQDVVQLWASLDGGTTWQREARAETSWPVVRSLADPPVLSLGRTLCTRDDSGRWSRWAELDDGIRAVAGDRSGVVVLTATGLWSLTADGSPGARLDEGLSVSDVLDIAADKDR